MYQLEVERKTDLREIEVEEGVIEAISLFGLATKGSYLVLKSRKVTDDGDSHLNIAFYALYYLGIVLLRRRTPLAYQSIDRRRGSMA